ncbi:peptidoglycan binding domain-containing protein [Pseudomonas knackmussii B13]|uniref:Peptidoglycan binding domain-containing protein n=1 Tax=Pseudomonas knackmussii (strain DSM 6978 / CCUG 54928 / LMG 23759 / B13) TaxID=1301098 RepID=A0A024HID9_PSEKB|nr:N-acetylmuramidase domain-containing protein [Pseudomonas knackmussii]CDF84272.1 peptidoglycan binding domain-containing protein [Pseudomonas knackmussii B13]
MDYQGKGVPLDDSGMDQVCAALGVADAEVWAVLTVETRGFGFLTDRRPQILFERHVFHRLTKGKFDAGNADISNVTPGGYIGGAGEYDRLAKAIALDKANALQSASWGIGQVMGFNFKTAGYASTDKFVAGMVKDENSQLLAMANFIKENGLAAAHAKYQVLLPDLQLRTAQAALKYLGFNPGPIDGIRGRQTTSALIGFQHGEGLPESGLLDQDTFARLQAKAFP